MRKLAAAAALVLTAVLAVSCRPEAAIWLSSTGVLAYAAHMSFVLDHMRRSVASENVV